MGSANDDRQTVEGKVTQGPDGATVEIGPVRVGPDGRAEAEVVFDRPLVLPLSALFPDPEARGRVEAGINAVLESDATRFDDLLAAAGLDPATDLAGASFAGIEFAGEPGRPLDMRGWDLSGCDLAGCRFEHVLADGTTNLAGADLDGAYGPDAGLVASLAAAPPRP
jgi:hypothetical protein